MTPPFFSNVSGITLEYHIPTVQRQLLEFFKSRNKRLFVDLLCRVTGSTDTWVNSQHTRDQARQVQRELAKWIRDH